VVKKVRADGKLTPIYAVIKKWPAVFLEKKNKKELIERKNSVHLLEIKAKSETRINSSVEKYNCLHILH